MSTHAVVQAVAASPGMASASRCSRPSRCWPGWAWRATRTWASRSSRADPTQPNLRQVHLIHGELLDELTGAGFRVGPGVMGENVTTRGIDRARGCASGEAIVEITGLRNAADGG